MLFIDKAYSLGCYGNLDGGLRNKGRGRDFGPEAIDALVKEMEDSDFICVMAGYPREMETMISSNPGLCDRVGFNINFPDYSDNELCEIFDYMIADRNYEVTEDATKVYVHCGLSLNDAINAFLIKSIEVGGFSFDLRSEPSAYEAISAIAYEPETNADDIAVLPADWDDDKDELRLP